MKVLQINVRAKGGSVGKIISSLNHRCQSEGIEFAIAYGRGNVEQNTFSDSFKIGTDKEIQAHALQSRIFGRTASYSKRGTSDLLKWIDRYNPDVIHLHGAYGYYVNMEMLFNYIADEKIPLISTLHSCWDFTGHCCYFDYPKCEEWKYGCNHCIRVHDYPECFFSDSTHYNLGLKNKLYHKLDKVRLITPSRWLQDLCEQSILRDIPVQTINNGIDINVYKTVEIEKHNKPIILCVANIWSERKGLDDILKLGDFLRDKAEIIVVGLSEKEIRKLPKNIVGITRTENVEELVKLYNSATIFFNPTHEENYPTVNLEAVACHLPVATYNTGGCAETIENGKYGIIVENEDFSTVVNFLMSVYDGKTCFDYSNLSYLSQQTMTDQYIKLYKDIIL